MKKVIMASFAAFVCLSMEMLPAYGQAVFSRASWLQGVQKDLFVQVEKGFKTRYDGSVWAKACKRPDMARRLGLDRKELRHFVFERLNERKDIQKIQPLEKWMLVNSVVDMSDAYLRGGRAFVRAGRRDCEIVLRGLNREFPK